MNCSNNAKKKVFILFVYLLEIDVVDCLLIGYPHEINLSKFS